MKTFPLIGIGVLALVVAGCGKEPAAPSATAPATIPPATQETTPRGPRIASTVPAATQMIVQLDALDELVGVSKIDLAELPAEKQQLPVVGDYDGINYELLVKLHPTALIIQMAPTRVPARLTELCAAQHIQLLNLQMETIEDLWKVARQIGEVAGKKDLAEARILAAKSELQSIADQYARRSRPRVVYLASSIAMMAVGGNTFIDQLITLAGGENAARAAGAGYPTINRERLIGLSPDVLLIGAPDEPASQGIHDPRLASWRSLPIPAAQKDRIFLITDPSAEQMTLGIAETARIIAAAIHAGEPASTPPTAASASATQEAK